MNNSMDREDFPDDLTPQGVLDWLDAFGVAIEVVDVPDGESRLRLTPPPGFAIPDEIQAAISRHKPQLLDLLREQQAGARPPIPIRPEVAPSSGGASPLPRIDAGHHNLPVVTALAWEALEAANEPPHLFAHAGSLYRLERGEGGRPALVLLTRDRLRHALARAAHWYRVTDAGIVDAMPPMAVVADMLATPEMPLPALRRIVEVPVFTASGALVDMPGYHADSGIYYAPAMGLSVPAVPQSPTADDVARALRILDDLLADFPFVEEEGKPNAERANALAIPLEILAREMIDGPLPMHLLEAPTAGSGKSLLADVLTLPVTGDQVAVIAECRDDDEWRKRLSTQFRALTPVILLDNVRRPLDSGVLAAALTALSWEDRLLGTNDLLRIPIRTAWVATANNPTVSTEIARRVVRTRLDPKVDRPWQRRGFRHGNLRTWAREHRAEILWALLTLVRSWVANGKREGAASLGSYERWAAVIGGILDNAGIGGFLANQQALLEAADVEGGMWRQFVALWWETYQGAEVGAGELFALAETVDGFSFGRGDERARKSSFGKQLMQQRDRVYGAYRIDLVREVKHLKQWRLIIVPPPAPPDEGIERSTSSDEHTPPVSADIQGETEGAVYVGVCFPTPPAREGPLSSPAPRQAAEVGAEHTPTYTTSPHSVAIAGETDGVRPEGDIHQGEGGGHEHAPQPGTDVDARPLAAVASPPRRRVRI